MTPSRFSSLLVYHRARRQISRNKLAHIIGVDPSYLTRVENGDRPPPRIDIIEVIARGLDLDPFERDQLLLTAGYAPVVLRDLDYTPEMHILLTALTRGLVHLPPATPNGTSKGDPSCHTLPATAPRPIPPNS